MQHPVAWLGRPHLLVPVVSSFIGLGAPESLAQLEWSLDPIRTIGSSNLDPHPHAIRRGHRFLPRVSHIESKAPQDKIRPGLPAIDLSYLFARKLQTVGNTYEG